VVRNGEIAAKGATELLATAPSVAYQIEDVLRCKWSLTILGLIRNNVCRPGAIERAVPGLTTKVMNERLTKLVAYKIVQRVSYPEVPPRVEYSLTDFGRKFVAILDAIEELEQEQACKY
jgi:DNA-binding HxlR family transcriptional regulator